MHETYTHDDHSRSRLMFDSRELQYDFGPGHPFQSRRLVALIDLLESSGLLNSQDERSRLPVRSATVEELSLIHASDYVDAVQKLSMLEATSSIEGLYAELAQRYGFAEGDTPVFPGMHEGAARIAGGTLVALSAVMSLPEGGAFRTGDERPLHVFHPAGGLHHAWGGRASGFCIYNDAAVAIAHVLRASEAKVLYIDFDAHHGDGVQRAFYDEPRVMTISFHETGRYLFPGTGDVLELGNGSGRGYSVNIPLEPFTEDDSFTEVMNAVLPPLVMSFAPDVIISQHGCDSHTWDPLTHLSLTLRGIQAQMQLAHQLAHTYCAGRWVALGGGGYDQFRVVPRAWSILWAEMTQQTLPEQLPETWIARWRPEWERVEEQEAIEQQVMGKPASSVQFPLTFQDRAEDFPAKVRRAEISQENHRIATLARHMLLPAPIRKAFSTSAASAHFSPMTGLFDWLHMHGRERPSRSITIETSRGPVLLRNFCPPSLVERLRPDSGLQAFARVPEREHQLLLTIAQNPECVLTVAHTPAGDIVGQVTLAFGDEWWEELENTFEVTIEVSSRWRGQGLARKMLAFALELDALEDMIIFAMGLSWHWDFEGLGISPLTYRKLISRLFGHEGFREQATTEPDIRMEPANVLLVRVGNRVDENTVRRFFSRIRSSPKLSGW
jgi:acetoin utilization deacetylase AcuC-like enzyme/GNAT superfamily N-acetyltransferase